MISLSKWTASGQAANDRVRELEEQLAKSTAELAKCDPAKFKEMEAKVAAIGRAQAVIEFNLDGTIIWANENFLGAVGYSLNEIVGRHHSMFVDREYGMSGEYRHFWERLNRGEFIAEKFRRVSKSGREIWIQASYNPLFDANGKAFKIVKFATDITAIEAERRKSEADRAQKASEQEHVVGALATGLKQLAEGNLAYRVNEKFAGEYEQLRLDFNGAIGKLQDKMQDALAGVNANADAVRTGAADLAQAADELSHRTEQQAASLEQTAAALSQITDTVRKTADNAKLASSTVATARNEAEHSGEIVGKAVSAMQLIEESSRKVSQIIGVIDEIAFQTNLLALNAGVEAARAGDAGRGFAVVASEVRALAQRAAEAAKEIKTLISASSEHVDTGARLVGETGQALSRIVQRVNEINTLIVGIASAAQGQATSLNEVNVAIGQMDQSTQQNAAMVEESTAAIHSLGQEANSMAALMAKFDLGNGQSSAARPTSFAPAPSHRAAQKPAAAKYGSADAQVSALRSKLSNGSGAHRPVKRAAAGNGDDWQEF